MPGRTCLGRKVRTNAPPQGAYAVQLAEQWPLSKLHEPHRAQQREVTAPLQKQLAKVLGHGWSDGSETRTVVTRADRRSSGDRLCMEHEVRPRPAALTGK